MVDTFSFIGVNTPFIEKSPGDASELDYTFDWTDWLAMYGDSLQSADVVCSGGLPATAASGGVVKTLQTDAFPLVHIKVKGGIVGTVGKAVCAVVTVQGRKDTRTMYFHIKDR